MTPNILLHKPLNHHNSLLKILQLNLSGFRNTVSLFHVFMSRSGFDCNGRRSAAVSWAFASSRIRLRGIIKSDKNQAPFPPRRNRVNDVDSSQPEMTCENHNTMQVYISSTLKRIISKIFSP